MEAEGATVEGEGEVVEVGMEGKDGVEGLMNEIEGGGGELRKKKKGGVVGEEKVEVG